MDIALVLSGGGIKGIAHIGVINQLEHYGFTIKAITGTSAGGLVGSLYAVGYTTPQLFEILNSINQQPRLFKRDPKDAPSLLGLNGLLDVIKPKLDNVTFDKLKIPFACTAVDLLSGKEVVIKSGFVSDAVLSTIAIPGVFPPKKLNDLLLVDGGIVDPIPVSITRWLAPGLPVVAVSLSSINEQWNPSSPIPPINGTPIPAPVIEYFSNLRLGQAYKYFIRSFDIMARNTSRLRLDTSKPDLIIYPDVKDYEMLQTYDPDDLIHIGELAVKKVVQPLNKLASFPNKIARSFRKSSLPDNIIVI